METILYIIYPLPNCFSICIYPPPHTQKTSLINGLKAYMHEGLFLANKILLLDSLLQEGRLKQLIDACKPLNLWTALSKVLHM